MDSGVAAPEIAPAPPLAPVHLRPVVALTAGWRTFRANVGISLAVMILLFLIVLVGEVIPLLNFFFILLAAPALEAGGARFLVRMVRGESPTLESAFDGFKRWPSATGAILMQMAMMFVFMSPMVLAMILMVGAETLAHADASTVLPPATILALVVTGTLGYVGMFWWFFRMWPVAFVVMEPDCPGAMAALRRSWAMTRGNTWRTVGLWLLAVPLELVGLCALCVGIIPAMIVWYYGLAHAYEQLRAGAAPESPAADAPAPPEPPPVFVP